MTNEDRLGKDREFTRDAIIKRFSTPKSTLGGNEAIEDVEITIDAKSYSPTELLLQIQALEFRDLKVNAKVAIINLYPTATLEFSLMDIKNFNKWLTKIKEDKKEQ